MNCTVHLDHLDCLDTTGEGSVCHFMDSIWMCKSPGHGGQCSAADVGEYDQTLHIVALFVVLVGSALGVVLPILAKRLLRNTLSQAIFFAARHFGTGVFLATSLIHLLYQAFTVFANPCLGTLAYDPAASAIALAGLWIVFLIDFGALRIIRARSRPPSQTNTLTNEELKWDHSHGIDYSSPQAHFDVNLLEAGIIFHSVMVGVTLGTSAGDQYKALFIAIVFHQFFEGLALGSRIGLLIWQPSQEWKKWMLALAFTLVTPLGIAIGIGVHASYNPNSSASLISVGVLNSVSAGILLYAGIVELLVADFIHGEMVEASKRKVVCALVFLMAGMGCMSAIGKWA